MRQAMYHVSWDKADDGGTRPVVSTFYNATKAINAAKRAFRGGGQNVTIRLTPARPEGGDK